MIRKRRAILQHYAGPETKVVFVFLLFLQALLVQNQLNVDGQFTRVRPQLRIVVMQAIESVLDFDCLIGQQRQQTVRVHVLFLVEIDGDRKDRHKHDEKRNFRNSQSSETFHNKGEYQIGSKTGDAKHADVDENVITEIRGTFEQKGV